MKRAVQQLFMLVFCACTSYAWAVTPVQVYVTEQDKELYERYISHWGKAQSLSMSELMIQTALYFLNTPYVASTLEKEPEGLVVNLREMDCTTFAENVLALSRTVKSGNISFDSFTNKLRKIRYRGGEIKDYADRLHYMTDWYYENQKDGFIRDINREIGGVVFPLQLSFISTHPDSYKQLKDAPELVKKMAAKEQEINRRSYFYVPEKEIPQIASQLKDGDIVCFTTSIKGLDVTHVGIIYHLEGVVTFIHASSKAGKVIVNPESLQKYVEGIKNNTGILVARPL